MMVEDSPEAVREWYQKGKEIFESTPQRERKRIAIDEKEIDIDGKKVCVWACVDVDNEEVLAVMVTDGRCYLGTLRILREIRKKCKKRLPHVFVDGGTWYPWALRRFGFNHTVILSVQEAL